MERRLAAILNADVVGYSRLMEDDEAGTHARMEGLKAEIIDPLISQHHGRIVKLMGDGFLLEFGSVVGALECAIAWQDAAETRARLITDDRAIRFRIGINLGEVIVKGDDVFGDGVNLAARLEGLAEAGDILVSRTVADHAKGKITPEFENLGERKLKNISEPVQVFRVIVQADGPRPVATISRSANRNMIWVAATGLAVLILVAGGALWWQQSVPREEPASIERMPFTLPDKPSIAVLPFSNLSEDASQEYFADGMTEDLITDLSKISGLFVIARNSSFTYKGKAVKIRQVAEELGVRYVLEGSVRRAGDQVRINAQLIDATTGGHLWAERYDGTLADVFSVQDKVTGQILDALKLQLTPTERQEIDTHGTNNPAAYDAYLRGLRLLAARKRIDIESNSAAQAELKEAIRLDPGYALAIAGLAWAKWLEISTINVYQSTDEVVRLAEKSLSIKDNALARRVRSRKHFSLESEFISTTRKPKLAAMELETARRLEPNNPDVLADLAIVLSFSGRPKDALDLIQNAMRLNPNHSDWYYGASGIALLLTGNSNRAVSHLRKWSESTPSWREPYIFLAAALANTGDISGAKAAVTRYSELFGPGTRTTLYGVQHKWPLEENQRELFQSSLQLAGVD